MAIRKIIGLTLGLCGVVIGIIIGMETLAGFLIPISAMEEALQVPIGSIFEKSIEIYSKWALKGIGAIYLSIAGAVGAGILVSKSEIGSWLMCIAGIGGILIHIPLYAILVSPLFLIGGILNNNIIINFLTRTYRLLFPPSED